MDEATSQPFEYETQSTVHARWGRCVVATAILVGPLGFLYWCAGDFYAYVDTGLERYPKFEMPLAWQIGESAGVGAIAATFWSGS